MLEKVCGNCNYPYREHERVCPNCGQIRGEEQAFTSSPYGMPDINEDISGNQLHSAEDVERINVSKSAKSRTTAGILAIVLGAWGVHKFYLGYYSVGIISILLCLVSGGLLYLVSICEGIHYLRMSDGEFYLTYVENEKHWF